MFRPYFKGGDLLLNQIGKFIQEEEGQGMAEYGIVLGAIAVSVFGLLVILSNEATEMYERVVQLLRNR